MTYDVCFCGDQIYHLKYKINISFFPEIGITIVLTQFHDSDCSLVFKFESLFEKDQIVWLAGCKN